MEVIRWPLAIAAVLILAPGNSFWFVAVLFAIVTMLGAVVLELRQNSASNIASQTSVSVRSKSTAARS